MLANYHTHTRWCRHADGEIEDYIKVAVQHGLQEIAITEHVPLQKNPDSLRMLFEEFPAFNRELDEMIEKYRSKIRVRKGMECEHKPQMMPYYKSLRDDYNYEIFILGQHSSYDSTIDYFNASTVQELKQYSKEVCEGIETGFYSFLAHPDVVLCGYKKEDVHFFTHMQHIFKTCAKMDLPVEINVNGYFFGKAYPCRALWQKANEYGVKCLVNSDAHSPKRIIYSAQAECEDMAKEFGLNLLSILP